MAVRAGRLVTLITAYEPYALTFTAGEYGPCWHFAEERALRSLRSNHVRSKHVVAEVP